MEPEKALRAELEPLKLSVVKKRARAVGVDELQLEEADDEDNIKGAVIRLILHKVVADQSTGRRSGSSSSDSDSSETGSTDEDTNSEAAKEAPSSDDEGLDPIARLQRFGRSASQTSLVFKGTTGVRSPRIENPFVPCLTRHLMLPNA